MDPASVGKALTVEPVDRASTSAWDATGRSLTVAPKTGWKPGTYYTITIAATAARRDRSGARRPGPGDLHDPRRRSAGGSPPSEAAVKGRRPDRRPTFSVTYDGPVDVAAVEAAFHVDPAVEGTFETSTTPAGGTTVTFAPTRALDSEHRLHRLDRRAGPRPDGVATTPLAPLAVAHREGPVGRPLPAVRRRRRASPGPCSCRSASPPGWTATRRRRRSAPGSARRSSRARFSWAEGDTVLVFKPAGRPAVRGQGRDDRRRDARPTGPGTPIGRRQARPRSRSAPKPKPPRAREPTSVAHRSRPAASGPARGTPSRPTTSGS